MVSFVSSPETRLRSGESQPATSAFESETADIETSSDDYARRFAGAAGEWFLSIQSAATLRMLAAHPNARVLDVGGGHGQLAEPLIRNGYDVTVLGSADVCKQRIQRLIDQDRCAFKVGNVVDLPYPDQSFDIVISYRLLPHVTRWQQLLAELARVARIAVMVDYPTVRSVNYIAPQLFKFKKRLEGNTRSYTCFKEEDLLTVFQQHHFARAERYPEFFLPMVLHRAMKSPSISAALERVFRFTRLTSVFGSPVILKLVRVSASR
jgi:ubiquinone/menaquinone biosynthesis C-methylase UbiE